MFVWSSDEKLSPNNFLLLKTFSPYNDLGNGGFSNMWSQIQICTGCFIKSSKFKKVNIGLVDSPNLEVFHTFNFLGG